jgi:hypothetical protein
MDVKELIRTWRWPLAGDLPILDGMIPVPDRTWVELTIGCSAGDIAMECPIDCHFRW